MSTSGEAVGRRVAFWLSLMVGAAFALGPAAAAAQSSGEPFEFSFSNPGARSMGIGGAFVAVADDATAAYANPAGLVHLLRPEISGELRIRVETPHNDDAAELTGLAFVSFVYPLRNWAFALYRNSLATIETPPGATKDLLDRLGNARRTKASSLFEALEIINFGASAAYRVSEQWKIGLGLTYFESNVTIATTQQTWEASQSDWGLNAGVLWAPNEQWNLGGSFRKGPEFDFSTPDGMPLAVPDVWALGAAWRSPNGSLALSLEWDRVQYSSLLDSLDSGLKDSEELTLADANEIHFGAEYLFLDASPVMAVRAGLWRDPDHALRRISDPPGTHEMHFTAGFGMVFKRFQLDFGIDLADDTYTGSTSMIWHF